MADTAEQLRAILESELRRANLDLAIRELGEPRLYNAVKAALGGAYDLGRADAEPLGGPVDPRFRPTRRDLVHLRIDAEAAGRAGFPVKVNLAPAVLYMGWPNSRHDPSDEDSTPYHCISFHIPKPQ